MQERCTSRPVGGRKWLLLIALAYLGSGPCNEVGRVPRGGEALSHQRSAAQVSAQTRPKGSEVSGAKRLSPLKKEDLSYEDRKAWRALLKWPDSCEHAFDYPDKSFGGLEFFQLAEHKYLVKVTCTLGTYQGYQTYVYLDETNSPPASSLVTFRTYESEDEKSVHVSLSTELWGTSDFDPKTKRLIVLNRFRGLGDCGTLTTYEFQNGISELKEVRAKLSCDGGGWEDPKRWGRMAHP